LEIDVAQSIRLWGNMAPKRQATVFTVFVPFTSPACVQPTKDDMATVTEEEWRAR
jgi:hypothetical protein